MEKKIRNIVFITLLLPTICSARSIDGFECAKWGMSKKQVKVLPCFKDRKWQNDSQGGLYYFDRSEALPDTNAKVLFEFFNDQLFIVSIIYLSENRTIENFKQTAFSLSLGYHDPVDIVMDEIPASAWWKDEKGQIMLLFGVSEEGKNKLFYSIYEPDIYKKAERKSVDISTNNDPPANHGNSPEDVIREFTIAEENRDAAKQVSFYSEKVIWNGETKSKTWLLSNHSKFQNSLQFYTLNIGNIDMQYDSSGNHAQVDYDVIGQYTTKNGKKIKFSTRKRTRLTNTGQWLIDCEENIKYYYGVPSNLQSLPDRCNIDPDVTPKKGNNREKTSQGNIFDAAKSGDLALVKRILSQNPSAIKTRGEYGNTPLHVAALHGRTEIVAYLLKKGANPNTKNTSDDIVPLSMAIYSRNSEICKLLIDSGADVNAKSKKHQMTPLHSAALMGDYDIVMLLLSNGANVNPRYKGGDYPNYTPLGMAIENRHYNVANIIKAYGGIL